MEPHESHDTPLVVVLGPTTSGKTRLGVALARRFAGEIVSVDSRQVYCRMDLGTGKDLAEYAATPSAPAVAHHLIDVVAPQETFDLHRFLALARAAVADITARGHLAVAVGGTPLYLKALLDGYELPGNGPDLELRRELEPCPDAELLRRLAAEDPALFARTDKTQRRRVIRALEIADARRRQGPVAAAPMPRYRSLLLAPFYPRPELHRRIAERLRARLAAGLVEEVAQLQRDGVSWERLEYIGLEYRWVAQYLQGRLTLENMCERLLAGIRNLCRAQEIWYRRFEREGKGIYWIRGGEAAAAIPLVEAFLAGRALPPPSLRLDDVRYGPRSQ